MEECTTSLDFQSKFLNSTFNTAIFDGSLRIYFSQIHEHEAFKIYFSLQNSFFEEGEEMNFDRYLPNPSRVIVVVYPDKDLFQSFFNSDKDFAFEQGEQDIVVGVVSPVTDQVKDLVVKSLEDHVFKK